MSAERPMDPAISQALEETQEALRREQRALGKLPEERARLNERREQLQAERDSIHLQLETLRKGQPEGAPRLSDHLPFEVRPLKERGRYFYWRGALAVMATSGLLMQAASKLGTDRPLGILPVVGMVFLVLVIRSFWKAPTSWFLTELLIDLPGKGHQRLQLPYSEVLQAEAHVSASQRHRGAGTVVVICKPTQQHPAGRSLVLNNAPEPERLVEWIRWKRSQ